MLEQIRELVQHNQRFPFPTQFHQSGNRILPRPQGERRRGTHVPRQMLAQITEGFTARPAHSVVVETTGLLSQILEQERFADAATPPDDAETRRSLPARGKLDKATPFALPANHVGRPSALHSHSCILY